MKFKSCNVESFQERLNEWHGGQASFNAYSEDHDRFVIKLTHPNAHQEPVGLAFFYCNILLALLHG